MAAIYYADHPGRRRGGSPQPLLAARHEARGIAERLGRGNSAAVPEPDRVDEPSAIARC